MKGMRLSTGRLVLFALLGAILVGLQVAMAALPNVEAVSLLVMVYTVVFGGAVAYILCVFVVLEMLIWGLVPGSSATYMCGRCWLYWPGP